MVRISLKKKPRKYKVGLNNLITIKDVGNISLKKDEQITFLFNKQKYDFTHKEWGFYISQSINGRVKSEKFKIALVKNSLNKYYMMAVALNKKSLFLSYCKKEKQKIIKWFDEK